MSSPVSRSLEYLRERGWVAHVVEKRNPFTKKLKDCFGGDILAFHPAAKRTMLVQATSDSNHGARVKKCAANEETKLWIVARNEFEVWSWKKGKREPRQEKLRLSDFTGR